MEHHLGRVSISDWMNSYNAQWKEREQCVMRGGVGGPIIPQPKTLEEARAIVDELNIRIPRMEKSYQTMPPNDPNRPRASAAYDITLAKARRTVAEDFIAKNTGAGYGGMSGGAIRGTPEYYKLYWQSEVTKYNNLIAEQEKKISDEQNSPPKPTDESLPIRERAQNATSNREKPTRIKNSLSYISELKYQLAKAEEQLARYGGMSGGVAHTSTPYALVIQPKSEPTPEQRADWEKITADWNARVNTEREKLKQKYGIALYERKKNDYFEKKNLTDELLRNVGPIPVRPHNKLEYVSYGLGHGGMNGGKDTGVPPAIPNVPDNELINMPDEELEQMALDGNDLQRMKDRRNYLKHLLKMADKLRKEQKHKKDKKDRDPDGGPGEKQPAVVKGHGNSSSKPVETTITIVPPVENDEETVSPEQEAIKAQLRGRFIAIREEEDAKRARNAEENSRNKINRAIFDLEQKHPRSATVAVAAAPSKVASAYLTKHPTTGSYYRNDAEQKADEELFNASESEAIDFLTLRARATLRAHLKREPTEGEVDAEVDRLNLRRLEAYARSARSIGSTISTIPEDFSQATYGLKRK